MMPHFTRQKLSAASGPLWVELIRATRSPVLVLPPPPAVVTIAAVGGGQGLQVAARLGAPSRIPPRLDSPTVSRLILFISWGRSFCTAVDGFEWRLMEYRTNGHDDGQMLVD